MHSNLFLPLVTYRMNKIVCVFVIIFLFASTLFSQKLTQEFELRVPEQKVEKSLYNKISFIDSRYDVTNMGIVQLGVFNRKAKVVSSIPFSDQLSAAMASLTPASAENGQLLLQLRQFNFAEVTSAVSEKGYCYIRALLYSKKDRGYQRLNSIDTVFVVKSMDVTKSLLDGGSKVITNFISSNLLKLPTDSFFFSLNDVITIDDYEKKEIAVYNTEKFTDGIYSTYQSFKNQQPDKFATVEMKDEKIISVKTNDETGKLSKVKSKDIYALVYDNHPYIATEFGYYLLRKTSNDFFFTGKAKVNANTADVVAASLFFGIIGGLIASGSGTDATFDMKIDHINGGFIRLKEVSGRHN